MRPATRDRYRVFAWFQPVLKIAVIRLAQNGAANRRYRDERHLHVDEIRLGRVGQCTRSSARIVQRSLRPGSRVTSRAGSELSRSIRR